MFTILAAILGIVIIIIVKSIVHNLYFSPLSKFPGPLICAVSRIPYLWYTVNGRLGNWVHDLHLSYGDIVRIAPDELTWITPEAWKGIYGHSPKQPANRKDPRFYGETPNGVQDILRCDDQNHARFRRALGYSLSERAVQEKEPMIRWHVDKLVSKVRSALASPHEFDVARMFNLTTFDVMAEFCFGEPLYLHDNVEYHDWVDSIFSVVKHMNVFRIARYARWTSIFLPPALAILGPMLKQQQHNFQRCVERVDRRINAKILQSDMWSRIVSEQFTRGEMYSTAQIMMLGGSETTATLVTGLTYYLLCNPQSMKKLCAEIHSFQNSSDITFRALTKLKYLQACILESFRLFPPVPVGMTRITPPQGSIICGQQIPGNTAVSVYGGAAAWNPRNFQNPDQFIPERWLKDPQYAQDKRSALQPFSCGPRDCVGQTFAYHEARLILATFLWHFDLSLCKESIGWPDRLRAYGNWEKQRLMVRITPRPGTT